MIQDRLNDKEHDIRGVQKQSSELLSIAWQKGYQAGFNDGYDTRREADQRQQGEWINHRNDYGHNIADCSLCGKAMQWHDEDEDGIPRYCWYCGADMRGEKK